MPGVIMVTGKMQCRRFDVGSGGIVWGGRRFYEGGMNQ